MKDVNKILREAYTTALENVGVPAYYQQAPDISSKKYITFRPINTTPVNIQTGSTVYISFQVNINTESEVYNDGDAADDIANLVYQNFLPHPGYVLDLGNDFQMVWTDLVSDVPNTFRLKSQIVAIDRVIIFKHTIFIR